LGRVIPPNELPCRTTSPRDRPGGSGNAPASCWKHAVYHGLAFGETGGRVSKQSFDGLRPKRGAALGILPLADLLILAAKR